MPRPKKESKLTTSCCFEIPNDIWNKFKETVPRTTTLQKAITGLIKKVVEGKND